MAAPGTRLAANLCGYGRPNAARRPEEYRTTETRDDDVRTKPGPYPHPSQQLPPLSEAAPDGIVRSRARFHRETDGRRAGRARCSGCRDIPGDISPCERFIVGFLEHGCGVVSGIRDLLIRGRNKVIGHYRLLLASARNEEERELYRSRIEREQRLLDELHGDFPDRFAA